MSAHENRPARVGEAAAKQTLSGVSNNDTPAGGIEYSTLERIVETTTVEYLDEIAADGSLRLATIRDELVRRIEARIFLENAARQKGYPRIPSRSTLDEVTIARVLLARRRIVRVDLSGGADPGGEMALLAMYVDKGIDEGVYDSDRTRLAQMVSVLSPAMSSKQVDSVLVTLFRLAPMVQRTRVPHLCPVAGGVYNKRTREVEPHSPDRVFLAKSPWDYDPAAQSPIIMMPDGLPWDFDSWLGSVSSDPEIVALFWQIIHAALFPFDSWDRTLWFIATSGANGKGTLLAVLRRLLGGAQCSSVRIADFGDRFSMEPLVRASVNLVDENDVGEYAMRLGSYKAIITGDVTPIDRKYKDVVSLQWRGLDIQCFNEDVPRVKDASPSFLRRLIMVPFDSRFSTVERKYIKSDYLARPEVLRYVLRRALEMDVEELSEPDDCKRLKSEYAEGNNPMQAFWEEFRDELVWDLVPFSFLHDLYVAYARKTNPSGKAVSQRNLTGFLKEAVRGTEWDHSGTARVPSAGRMSKPELLIARWGLEDWMNPSYRVSPGGDPAKVSVPVLESRYRGLVRRSSAQPKTITVINGVPADLQPYKSDSEEPDVASDRLSDDAVHALVVPSVQVETPQWGVEG